MPTFTINTDAIAKKVTVDTDHKWGRQLRFVNDEYCGKLLELLTPALSSLHLHKKKTETFIILAGEVEVETETSKTVYTPGGIITLPPFKIHRFRTFEPPVLILEVSSHDDDRDIEIIEESKWE